LMFNLLKNDPAEIGRMLAEEQAARQAEQQKVEANYQPHFEELRRLIAEKRAEAEAAEQKLAEETARLNRGQQ